MKDNVYHGQIKQLAKFLIIERYWRNFLSSLSNNLDVIQAGEPITWVVSKQPWAISKKLLLKAHKNWNSCSNFTDLTDEKLRWMYNIHSLK